MPDTPSLTPNPGAGTTTPPAPPTTAAPSGAVGAAQTAKPQKPVDASGRAGAGAATATPLLKPDKLKLDEIKTTRVVEYMPIQVIFLSGPYAGRKLELGLVVNEASQDQTAEWQDQQGQAIRVGSNFVALSQRTVSISLMYWSDKVDVSPYAEACASLMQIGDGDATPPRLHFQQGLIRMIPCVCTKFSPRYESPFPGNKGFRQVTVELGFKLLGGSDSPHRLGAPLTDTRLLQEKRAVDPAAYAKRGKELVAESTIMHCLANAIDQGLLKDLIGNKGGQGNNPSKWQDLSADGLTQAAVAGLIPPGVLKDPGLQSKLREGLATTMAQKTYGLKAKEQGEYAQALRGQNFGLSDTLRTMAAKNAPNFEKLYQTIIAQDLGEGSAIFNGELGETLLRTASCGLEYRSIGSARVAPTAQNDERTNQFWKKALGDKEKFPGARDKYIIDKINEYLRSGPSDEDIKKRFGLNSDEQVRALKAGGQFQSVDQFERYLSGGSNGIAGYVVYQNFLNNEIDKTLADKDKKEEA